MSNHSKNCCVLCQYAKISFLLPAQEREWTWIHNAKKLLFVIKIDYTIYPCLQHANMNEISNVDFDNVAVVPNISSLTKNGSHRCRQFIISHDYHDHSTETKDKFLLTKLNNERDHGPMNSEKTLDRVTVTFPNVLHLVLSKASENGFDHIISWWVVFCLY